jgi:DNA-binding NtrC family response regulator
MADILVVDDDQSIVEAFERFLADERHVTRVAGSAHEALRLIDERRPDLVIMDVRMPGVDGLQALQDIRGRFPDLYVVIMTAYGTSQTSIDAIRSGAFDYLTKPLDLDDLRRVIDKALEAQHIQPATTNQADALADTGGVSLVGHTPAMQEVYKLIARLSSNEVPALIVGERGTGKQLVAETIHDNSARRDRPFAALDCATLTEAAVAELFGDDAATILLANVEAMPAALQAQLVRALGEQRGRATTSAPRLTARVLASTERDLGEELRHGNVNRELFETLSVITIRMPPLRERRDDIPVLVAHLIQRFNVELSRSIKGVDGRVAQLLHEHGWPGNVRELESVIKRACILARGDVITGDDLGESLAKGLFPAPHESNIGLRAAVTAALHERLTGRIEVQGSPFHDIVDLVEETLVREALTLTNGNQVKAAETLGVNRATLRKKRPE